jgi:hypothetical protein
MSIIVLAFTGYANRSELKQATMNLKRHDARTSIKTLQKAAIVRLSP